MRIFKNPIEVPTFSPHPGKSNEAQRGIEHRPSKNMPEYKANKTH